ncbi:MAG: NAD(P)-dependent oxidoreductase [Verrucomicrobia bacterium]|nr:MAG: NAD(P)-dependent oxidoreductase [Verrucomicrobiota bacterium]
MELLLTGSTGFVGRNLLLRIHRDNRWSRIILPVRNPEKLLSQLEGEGVSDGRFAPCRVTGDFWELPSGAAPELVIHAAGLLFGRRREEYFKTNVEGTLRLIAQLPRTTRIIVLSSQAAGGPTPRGEHARTMHIPDKPVSFYGASKLTMERELRNRLGWRLLILRPSMVLGPRDGATLPLFKMAAGPVRVKPGFKAKHYSWIDIDDLCDGILAAALVAPAHWEKQGPFYLGSGTTITDSELIATAARVIESRGITLPLPQAAIQLASLVIDSVPAWREAVPSLGSDRVREILPDRWVCDSRPFSEHFDWNSRGNLENTLRSSADWLKNQGKI